MGKEEGGGGVCESLDQMRVAHILTVGNGAAGRRATSMRDANGARADIALNALNGLARIYNISRTSPATRQWRWNWSSRLAMSCSGGAPGQSQRGVAAWILVHPEWTVANWLSLSPKPRLRLGLFHSDVAFGLNPSPASCSVCFHSDVAPGLNTHLEIVTHGGGAALGWQTVGRVPWR